VRIFYPGVGPAGSPELRLDQLEAIYRTHREITEPGLSKNVLVGAGMGSGKTVVSVEVILKSRPKRVLIVGVRDAYSQWAATLKEQQTGPEKDKLKLHRIISTTQIGRDNLAKLVDGEDGLYYVGMEMLRAQDWETVSETSPVHPDIKAALGDAVGDFTIPEKRAKQSHTFASMRTVDLLISDEAHRHSNQKAKALKTIETIPALAKIALSGTFFGNKFENAWALTLWLWTKKIIGAKGVFEAKWCVKVPVMSKDGMRQIRTPGGFPVSKIMGEREPGEFVKTLPCYVFIATPIGPVPAPEIVKVELGPEQARQYREMEHQSLTWIPTASGVKREPLVADLPITQRQRLRTAALAAMTLIPGADEESSDSITFAVNCKSTTLDAAYKVLHRPSWVGKKVLILTHSKPFAEEVARRIGQKYRVGLKTGGVSSAHWDIDKASFMRPVSETDSVQYLVAVISAVGTAMDGLQANCAKVLWLSEDENNTNNMQGANRIWRDGVDLDEYEAVKLVQTGTIAEGVLVKNRAHKRGVLGSIEGPAS
jgi:hypothetical protein